MKEEMEPEDDGCPELLPFPENLPHARSRTAPPGRGSPKLTTLKVCVCRSYPPEYLK